MKNGIIYPEGFSMISVGCNIAALIWSGSPGRFYGGIYLSWAAIAIYRRWKVEAR